MNQKFSREIKFRAWDKINGGMMYHNSISGCSLDELVGKEYEGHLEFMQYTGLFDKNGKEIYEGDIVKDSGKYPVGYRHDFVNQTAVVEFQTELGGWFISDRQNMLKELQAANSDKWEIIGNIYQNKDLLEAKS